MDYIIISAICLAAVIYLILRFRGVFKGKKDMGCGGCNKTCSQRGNDCPSSEDRV